MTCGIRFDTHYLRAHRHRPVPGAVLRHKQIALIFRREFITGVEFHPQRRGVGLHFNVRRDAVFGPGIIIEGRIGDFLTIGIRPPVKTTFPDSDYFLRRQIVVQMIPAVHRSPKFGGVGPKLNPHGIPQSGGKDFLSGTI
ncbi:MAG: hypothetical protein MAGBODY4_01582 [Candidatus Marinimicrobia bacterium]|nr:hypothetical protein [Candidatus Neomarinimicrobiota bacterium]